MTEVKTLDDLTERQRAFVSEYIVDLNGARAAIRAGYAPISARCEAARQLANVNVSREIDRLLEARGERTQINADRVVKELAKLAFSDIRSVAAWTATGVHFTPSDDLDDATSAAVLEISEKTHETKSGSTTQIKVKMHDKLKALELLARHLGMLKNVDDDQFAAMTTRDLVVLMKQKLPEIEGQLGLPPIETQEEG